MNHLQALLTLDEPHQGYSGSCRKEHGRFLALARFTISFYPGIRVTQLDDDELIILASDLEPLGVDNG